ncbi:MAG: hypothetical protein JOZ41_11065, partial [Chloroflexi bacterium]|nr:hypothetical protein [Chloroflexota bacterium]
MNTPHRWPLLTSAVAILALLLAALTPAAVPRAAAAGSLQLSRGMAAPGDSVSVSGAGFTPSDTVVVIANFNVNGSTQQVQNATHVNGNGTFSTGFTVPAGAAPGDYKVTAKDFHGVVTTQTLTVLHLISLQVGAGGPTVYIIAGHSFYAQGRGFKGGETVVLKAVFPLYNGNPVTVSKTVGTDTKGTFGETLLQVPNGAKTGAVTLTGTGEQSQKKATATLHPTYQPAISLSASTVRPGGTITVSGRGYVPGATVRVAVTIPRTSGGAVTLSAAANADQNGNFSASLVVPANTQPSTYTVEATDLAGGFKATAQVLVSVKPGITIQPGAVSPGNRVLVSGGGYSAGVQVTVSATFPLYGGGTRTVSTTATTNGNGQFQASLVVPGNAAAGGVTIAAAGPHGRSYANLQVNRIAAGISVSPSSVIPGSSVTIKGSGYPANDR